MNVDNVFFVKGLAEQSKDRAVTSGRRLYYVGNELFLGGFVEIFNRFSGVFLMLGETVLQIVIGVADSQTENGGELINTKAATATASCGFGSMMETRCPVCSWGLRRSCVQWRPSSAARPCRRTST